MIKLAYWYVSMGTILILGGHHIPLVNGLGSERRKSNQGRLERGGREIIGKPWDYEGTEDKGTNFFGNRNSQP